MCIRPLTVAVVVLLGASGWASLSSMTTVQATAHCHKGSACGQGQRRHGVAAPAQTPASDMRRLAARAQAASAPCFNGFVLVRRDLSALAGTKTGRAHGLAALNADAQADQRACLRGAAALGSGAIPRSLQHSALTADFVAHLRSALYETAHACADALQVVAAANADNATAANGAVADFGRTLQQQHADTTAAANDLLRLSAAFHL
jgi:hypothetical protein